MSASMFSGIEMVLSRMISGSITRTIVEADGDRLIVMSSGTAALLAVVTDSSEDLNGVLEAMDKSCERIRKILG
jgi:predicted regulator of Ras-like GTPase activity (Roadblock/LC7/MglB family)